MNQSRLPSVEVLIATYNRRHHLEKLLDKLREQTYANLRVTVRDDGSSDGTADIVQSQFPAVRLLGGQHLGQIPAKSALLTAATSDYLLYLDDDGYLIEPEAAAGCVAQMEAHPRWGCLSIRVRRPDGSDEYNAEVPSAVCIPYFSGTGHMMRRSVVDRLGGYCDLLPFYSEEPEYTVRMAIHGWPVVFSRDFSFLHMREAAGRDERKIARYRCRNKMLIHFLHSPFSKAVGRSAALIAQFATGLLRPGRASDLAWVLRETAAALPAALRRRRPMSRPMWALWRSLYRLTVTPEEFLAAYRQTPECRILRPELLEGAG